MKIYIYKNHQSLNKNNYQYIQLHRFNNLENISTQSMIARLIKTVYIQPTTNIPLIWRTLSFSILISYFTILPILLSIIWPSFENTFSSKVLFIVTINMLNLFITLSYNFVMIWIYRSKIPFFEQFRVNKVLWQWQKDWPSWKIFLRQSIELVATNILFWSPLLTTVDSSLNFNCEMNIERVPSTSTIVCQFVLFLLVQEILFYSIHRWMHNKKWYWIHKPHHQYNITVSLAAEHAHPIEQLFLNTFAFAFGFKILSFVYPVHIFTILIWQTFRIVQSLDNHSGYLWPWRQSALIPFSAGAHYHSFHHYNNVGNFGGILNFMDSIFDTNQVYLNILEKEKEKLA